jgi:hypothetical protein
MSANESLGRAQELAERLRAKLDNLEQLADAGDVDAAVDDLAEIAADRGRAAAGTRERGCRRLTSSSASRRAISPTSR